MRRADLWRRIDAALTAEATAIRAADFSHLETLIAEKARLTDRLADVTPAPTADMLERLQSRAQRNAVLLQAAMSGLRAARSRIDALQNGGHLRTYDRSGVVESAFGTEPALNRRA